MSVVSLLGVKVLRNPAGFNDPYEFEITFECLEQLTKDLEWKLVYVGSATSWVEPVRLDAPQMTLTHAWASSDHDQELDSLLVGPIPVGVNKFIFEADPPKLNQIPASEILGVTVILLTCSYDGREFVRVGYYVNNEYDSDELNAEPPAKPVIERVRRNILAEKPRVTRFAIKWDSEESAPAEYPPDQPEADAADDDAEKYGAEEVELEQALIKEEAELVANLDEDMAGAEDTAGPATKGEDEESDGGSEDLEAESSGSEDEEGEEEEAEAEAEAEAQEDEDMEMGDSESAPKPASQQQQHPGGEVMVH